MWEDVATELKGDLDNYVNVAEVDCHANREVGARFNITGFPMVKMFSKGRIYNYEGAREIKAIVQFARGEFMFHSSELVPPDLGLFGEVIMILKHAYTTALNDIENGHYYTKDIFLMSFPFLFFITLILITCVPSRTERNIQKMKNERLKLKKKNDLVEADDDDEDVKSSLIKSN